MQIEPTSLPGVLVLTPRRFRDDRGYFSETWNRNTLAAHGIDWAFAQDNQSLSRLPGTVRGLHFQAPPHVQGKLMRVVQGVILDVAVDARRGSPTYGQWVGVELSAETGRQLLIPAGFLHGFVTRTPECEIAYKCTDVYAAECDGAVHFADPDLAIDWGIAADRALVSEKDAAAQSFADFVSPFAYEGPLPYEDRYPAGASS